MLGYIRQNYCDETLCGYHLIQTPSKLWKFTLSDDLYFVTRKTFMNYLELSFRRAGGRLFTACAYLSLKPIGIALSILHALWHYVNPTGLDIRQTLAKKGKHILSDIYNFNNLGKIAQLKFFINIKCNEKNMIKSDFILRKPNEESFKSAFNKISEDVVKTMCTTHAKSFNIEWKCCYQCAALYYLVEGKHGPLDEHEAVHQNEIVISSMGLINTDLDRNQTDHVDAVGNFI
jgi:hypothetical protein